MRFQELEKHRRKALQASCYTWGLINDFPHAAGKQQVDKSTSGCSVLGSACHRLQKNTAALSEAGGTGAKSSPSRRNKVTATGSGRHQYSSSSSSSSHLESFKDKYCWLCEQAAGCSSRSTEFSVQPSKMNTKMHQIRRKHLLLLHLEYIYTAARDSTEHLYLHCLLKMKHSRTLAPVLSLATMCTCCLDLHPLQIRLCTVCTVISTLRRMADRHRRQERWCFISSWCIVLCFYLGGERLSAQFITASFCCSRSLLLREWHTCLNNTLQLCEPVLALYLPTCAAMEEREKRQIFMRSGHLAKQKPLWATGENETHFMFIIKRMNNVSIHKGQS